MPLANGTRLGPYEILAPLGAGAMGEVYRARDTRLSRQVAIKVLPAAFASDPERRARFETESRIIAALSHPNVLALHDLGTEKGVSYAVMELVEGQTLRERLADGPIPPARATALAIQIAQGLAAAHDQGVVHRDLKPENVIVTPEGRVKLLDFGLARRQLTAADSNSMAPTMAHSTEPGAVLGTVAYMSPEQVRGEKADARADVFALGVVLYEMLAGARPFTAGSAAETMSAILREEPAELSRAGRGVSPALEHIVKRCLEKQPAARFRSAADLAYALEAVATSSSGAHVVGPAGMAGAAARPRFKRITFRNGMVAGARFVPDGSGVVFGASWEGRPFEVFTAHPGSPEARSLGLPPANLLAISASGEMALSLGYHHFFWNQAKGTLARNALGGGGVRPLQKDVAQADWSPDGKTLAVIRYADGMCQLEFAGQTLLETPDWLSRPRVSRDGRTVAVGQHMFQGDTMGSIVVVDSARTRRVLAPDMTSVSGLAWSAAGDELWYSGINAAQQNGIWAVSLDGTTREIFTSPARITLHDIALNGRVLIGLGNLRLGLSVSRGVDEPEVDLSWFDGSVASDISADGRTVLFTEGHEAENPHYACYLRDVDGSPAVRLGDGVSTRLSADGQWALGITLTPRHEIVAYPVGIGEPRSIPIEGIERIMWTSFHPDGQRLYVVATTAGRANRLYIAPAQGGAPTLLWDEPVASSRITGPAVSRDGDRVAVRLASGENVLLDAATRTAVAIAGLTADDTVVGFDETGEHLFVLGGDASARRVHRLSLATGERTSYRTLAPPDPTGVFYVGAPVLSLDGRVMAYSYYRHISDLYVVEGLG